MSSLLQNVRVHTTAARLKLKMYAGRPIKVQ